MNMTVLATVRNTFENKEFRLLHFRRLRTATTASLGVMLLLLLSHQIGLLATRPLLWLEGLIAANIAIFGLLYFTGLNQRFKDPGMTLAQTLASSSVMLLTAHLAQAPVRVFAMLLLAMAFAFASFRFGIKDLLRFGALIVALAAIESALAIGPLPGQLSAGVALLNVGALALTLATLSQIGGSLNDLRRNARFERAMAEQAADKLAVVAVDAELRVTFLNIGAARLLGQQDQRPKVGSLAELISLQGPKQVADLVREHRENVAGVTLAPSSATLVNASGGATASGREVEISISTITGQRSGGSGNLLVFRDVTDHNRMLRELQHAATHDELTRLQNRRGFVTELTRLLNQDLGAAHEHALLLIDLDQFKVVNDNCGHQAGDDLLCAVASILRSLFPEARCLARLGGDEFAVLLSDVDADCADLLASDLLAALSSFRLVRKNLPLKISASIGATSLRGGDLADDVIARADAACYIAKDRGRNQVRRYHAGAQETIRHHSDLHWAARINHALEANRFSLYAQLIVPANGCADDELEYELLLRMIGDDDVVIYPDDFLPAAERFGLMPAIDRWVIRTAMDQLTQLAQKGVQLPKLALNVSATSLRDASLALFITEQLDRSRLAGSLFTFELTESAAIINFALANDFILSVQALGCRVALDDVGTGFCSFAHLKMLPVDQIKIDGSFVRTVCHDPLNRVMVESLHRIAKVLGVTTVAEFVETDQIRQALCTIGVDFVQGYGIHRPAPLLEVFAEINKRSAVNGATAAPQPRPRRASPTHEAMAFVI